MNVNDLIVEASRRGVLLSVRGERLAYDAPADVMDADFRASLDANKAELLALLEDQGTPRSASADGPVARPWEPRPLPWRAVTGNWPIPRRERWGRLANRYAEEGVPFPEDERRAFDAISAEDDPISDRPRDSSPA